MPLLISKMPMKKLKCTIDLEKDEITILNEKVKIRSDSSKSHYELELLNGMRYGKFELNHEKNEAMNIFLASVKDGTDFETVLLGKESEESHSDSNSEDSEDESIINKNEINNESQEEDEITTETQSRMQKRNRSNKKTSNKTSDKNGNRKKKSKATDWSETEHQNLKTKLIKLHQQLGHPQPSRLIEFLKKAKFDTGKQNMTKTVQKISDECTTCKHHKRVMSRPSVCLPLSSDFNEILGIDIATYNKRMFLKIICLGTRFMQAAFIPNKKSETIIKTITKLWLAYFGMPKWAFLADNASETISKEFGEFCDESNVRIMNSPAQAQHANGITERHGAVIKETMRKLQFDENGIDFDLLIAKSIAAHNVLANVDGSSPSQRVFGINPNFSSVLTDSMAAMTSQLNQKTTTLMHRLQNMSKAKSAFIHAESNRRIKKALSTKRCNNTKFRPKIAQWVQYWDKGVNHANSGIRGPAKVIGYDEDAKTVLMKRHNRLITRHVNSVRDYPHAINVEEENSETQQSQKNASTKNERQKHHSIDAESEHHRNDAESERSRIETDDDETDNDMYIRTQQFNDEQNITENNEENESDGISIQETNRERRETEVDSETDDETTIPTSQLRSKLGDYWDLDNIGSRTRNKPSRLNDYEECMMTSHATQQEVSELETLFKQFKSDNKKD
jgi:hypothetical protein